MKRIIYILLILSLMFSLLACKKNKGDEPDEPDIPAEETVYTKLNDLSKKTYSRVALNISTTTDGITLGSSYVLMDNYVSYSVEQLNLLPSDGILSGQPSRYKQELSGTARIRDGQIIQFDGDVVYLPSYEELTGGFHYHESYFKNVSDGEGRFEAEVISISGLTGADINVSNAKISVDYNDTSLKRIIISYNTDLSYVNIVYQFTQ